MTPRILILAAGSSSRMRGGDKLLESVDGQPQLARIIAAALATGLAVTVALPPDNPARLACLTDNHPDPACAMAQRLTAVLVPNPHDGMAASLKAGLASLPALAPVLLVLADLPEITAQDLTRFLGVWQQHPRMIARGTAQDGSPGHPVGLPGWLRPELMDLHHDQGAREVMTRHPDKLLLIALPDRHATTDLDTPEDWARWRAERLGPSNQG